MGPRKQLRAFLGADTEFEGRLVFSGELEVDGCFTGEIAASGCLTIGPQADITADVHVDVVCIHGRITGNVLADCRLEIFPGGKVFGDIEAPEVILHDGGTFEGACSTRQPAVSRSGDNASDISGVQQIKG